MKHTVLNTESKMKGFLNVDLVKVKVEHEDDHIQIIDRFLVHGKNAASVLVYDRKNDLTLMIEQFRIGMVNEESCRSLECPAGLIDEGETASQAIVRELREETGLDVTEDMLEQVTDSSFFSSGMMTHTISIFTCECDLSNVKEGVYGTDHDEYIHTRLIPYSTMIKRLKNKEIKHVSQVAALQHSIISNL